MVRGYFRCCELCVLYVCVSYVGCMIHVGGVCVCVVFLCNVYVWYVYGLCLLYVCFVCK